MTIRNLARDHDVLIGLGNWAIPGLSIPQLTLCHWPYALYDDSEIWDCLSAGARVARRVKRALFDYLIASSDVVMLQTDIARSRFLRRHPGNATAILPNVVSEDILRAAQGARVQSRRETGDILVLARYYPHKNFEVLIPVAEALRDSESPWRIVTTLDPAEHRGVREFLRKVESRGLGQHLVNRGPIPRGRLEEAYRAAGVLLLPSLLESFSGAYLEAMAFGVPVVTSDRDFARAVCGDAARYVDPKDPTSLIEGLKDVLLNESNYDSLVRLGRERVQGLPSLAEVIDEIEAIIENVVKR